MTETTGQRTSRGRFWQTLRFRFAVWTAGLLLIILMSFGTFIYLTMERSLSDSVDEVLRLNASQALGVVEFEDGILDLPSSFVEGPETTRLRDQGFILRILGPDGQVLRAFGAYKSLPVTPLSIAAARDQVVELTTLTDPTSGDTIRLYSIPIVTEKHTIGIYQVGRALTDVQDTLGRLLRVLLFGVPVLVMATGLGGYLLAARALAPIDEIARTARRISAEDLSSRLNLPATGDEVGRLAATFDDMLARLESSFQRERRFTADASHELRTPLAAMQAILEVIRAKPRTPEEYQQALSDLGEEAGRMRILAENLLALARGDVPTAASREDIDLSILLTDVADSLRPLAEARGLALECAPPGGLLIKGDMDALIRLFENLLDNAIKYTVKGSVQVRAARTADQHVSVTIADTGAGIPSVHLPHIFDRFYRVDESRTTNGAGLGLAIAQEIAQAHHGTIEVSSVPRTGTTFIVFLPLADSGAAAKT